MPDISGASTNTILIRGNEVPVVIKHLAHTKLSYYLENPRVYSSLHGKGKTPTQEEIQERLLDMEHVRELINDIRINQGLIEPLIVRDETFEVLEGNSRLAAYRFLAKKDPVKWGTVKCTVLPYDIGESLIFALLGQFHIKGKKDWVPFEQAGFLYRRFKNHHVDIKTLALEIGISSKKVTHLVDTYEFMVKNDDEDVNRWSYYDEYLKSKKIQRAREQYPEFDSLIVEKIKSKEIQRAVDLRDQLRPICSTPKILKKFVSGDYDFSEAFTATEEAGGTSKGLKFIKKFREWLTRPNLQEQLLASPPKIRNSVIFELGKIELRVKAMLKKLD
jgi:ParB-like nuclease family protein